MSDVERFMKFVSPEPNSGCWLWMGRVQPNGYGQFRIEGRTQYAHRVSLKLFAEGVGENDVAMHKCDTRCCVNPSHIVRATQGDNLLDMVAKGRNPDRRGEKAIKVRLKESDIPLIRTATGSCREIGEKFGVNHRTVWSIRARKTWRHVRDPQ